MKEVKIITQKRNKWHCSGVTIMIKILFYSVTGKGELQLSCDKIMFEDKEI